MTDNNDDQRSAFPAGDRDDIPMTRQERQELRERYGFKPGEREAIEAEMAERAAKIKLEETLAWCRERNARQDQAAPVTKDYHRATMPTYQAPARSAADDHWDKWRKFILATVRKEFATKKYVQDGFATAADEIGKFVDKMDNEVCQATKQARETALAPLRTELAELRAEVAELRERLGLDQERGGPRIRAVPSSTPSALIA